MQLALRLGKTLGEIFQIPSAELTEWKAFFILEQRESQQAQPQARGSKRSVPTQGKQPDVQATMRAMFGDRVKKKERKT
jgi:hypothetical protein